MFFKQFISKSLYSIQLKPIDFVWLRTSLIKIYASRDAIAALLLKLQRNIPFLLGACHSITGIATEPMPKQEDKPIGVVFRYCLIYQ